MKKLFVVGLFALLSSPALAVPYCDVVKLPHGGVDYGFGNITEDESAQRFEQELHAAGVDAHQTRFWNGCIQTFVTIDGKDVMKFYNPENLQEMPAN